METYIAKFAERYRLRTQRDTQGEVFIPCKRGQIYHHGGDTFGVMVITEGKARSSPKIWANVRRGLLAAGFTLRQTGDSEGSVLFNAHNPEMARAAIRWMRARRKREVTTKLLAHLGEIGKSRRFVECGDKRALGKDKSLREPAKAVMGRASTYEAKRPLPLAVIPHTRNDE